MIYIQFRISQRLPQHGLVVGQPTRIHIVEDTVVLQFARKKSLDLSFGGQA